MSNTSNAGGQIRPVPGWIAIACALALFGFIVTCAVSGGVVTDRHIYD